MSKYVVVISWLIAVSAYALGPDVLKTPREQFVSPVDMFGSACISQDAIYYSKFRFSDPTSQDLVKWEIKSNSSQVLEAVDGVINVHCTGNKVLVERKLGEGLGVEWLVWNGEGLKALAEGWPELNQRVASARLRLFQAGKDLDPDQGDLLRGAVAQSLSTSGDGFLLRVEDQKLDHTKVPATWLVRGNFEEDASVSVLPIWIEANEKVLRTLLLPGEDVIALVAQSDGTGQTLALVNKGDGAIKKRFGAYHYVDALAVFSGAEILIHDRGKKNEIAPSLTVLNLENGESTALAIPARDLQGLVGLDDGILIYRRSGMEWYSKAKLFGKSIRELPTKRFQVLENADKKATLFVLEDSQNGNPEWIPLAAYEQIKSLAQVGEHAVLIGVPVKGGAVSTPGFLESRLELATNEAANLSNEADPFHSDTKSHPLGLYGFHGRGLSLARLPFPQEAFSKVIVSDDGRLRVSMADSNLTTFPYYLEVSHDLNAVMPRSIAEASKVPAVPRNDVRVAKREADKERAVLAQAADQIASKLLFSWQEELRQPALPTLNQAGDKLYFSEYSPTERCRGKNVYRVNNVAQGPSAPETILENNCVIDLYEHLGSVYVTLMMGDVRRIVAVEGKGQGIESLFPGSEYLVRWKLDVAQSNLGSLEPIDRYHLLGFGTDDSKGYVYLSHASERKERILSFDLDPNKILEAPVDQRVPKESLINILSGARNRAKAFFRPAASLRQSLLQLTNETKSVDRAGLITWNVAAPGGEAVYGKEAAYIYSEPWKTLPQDKWSIRTMAAMAVTQYGFIVADGTRRGNEWPMVAYFSPYLVGSGPNDFTRIPWLDGSEISGLQYSSKGLVVSYPKTREIRLFGPFAAARVTPATPTVRPAEPTAPPRAESADKGKKPTILAPPPVTGSERGNNNGEGVSRSEYQKKKQEGKK